MAKDKKPLPRLSLARISFAKGDLAASAKAHTPEAIAQAAAEQHGGAGSQYIGDMVLGGLDGIITTFAVVSGVAGAGLGRASPHDHGDGQPAGGRLLDGHRIVPLP